MSNSVKVIKTKVEFEDIVPKRNYEFASKRSSLVIRVYVKRIKDGVLYCNVEENQDKYLASYEEKYLKRFNIYSIEEKEIEEFTMCSNPKCNATGEKLYWIGKELLCSKCMGERLIKKALEDKVIYDNWATNC